MIKAIMVMVIGTAFAKPIAKLTFVDSATINDTAIYLRDIAVISSDSPDISKRLSETFAGESAPPGYSRFINTADLVLYRLQSTGIVLNVSENKRITVKTVGIVKKIGDYTDKINDYLSQHIDWKQGEWQVVIENSEETFKCLDLPMDVSIEATSVKKTIAQTMFPRGHISLQCIVKQRGRTVHVPVICLIKISAPIVVAKHVISRGKVIDSNDIELKKVDLPAGFSPDLYLQIKDLIGQKSVSTINQGTILFNKLLSPVPIISKGDQLAICVAQGNVRISVLAIARENGSIGQKIWVENETTHKIVHVVVKNKNTAVVL
jgi:flagella basal body P-ring formation protein FlgA